MHATATRIFILLAEIQLSVLFKVRRQNTIQEV